MALKCATACILVKVFNKFFIMALHFGDHETADWLWHRKMDWFYRTVGEQSTHGW
jgi:hypothetical protein